MGHFSGKIPVFDLDGTLLDSDEALAAPFLAMGVPREDIRFGPLLAEECARLGLEMAEYVARYDPAIAPPFPGVELLVAALGRWAVCSNKLRDAGRAEMARLGWRPDVALFAEDFGAPKSLPLVLGALGGVRGADIVFIGDTEHDRVCAAAVGAPFVLAGWNPRSAGVGADVVVATPAELLGLLGLG